MFSRLDLAAILLLVELSRCSWAVQYQGLEQGDSQCVCYDWRTDAALGGGAVLNCQHPLGRITATMPQNQGGLGIDSDERDPVHFICGNNPNAEYNHLCCDTCSDNGCQYVWADPSQDYADPDRYPDSWAAFNAVNPANYNVDYKTSTPAAAATPASSSQSATSVSTASSSPPVAPALASSASSSSPSSTTSSPAPASKTANTATSSSATTTSSTSSQSAVTTSTSSSSPTQSTGSSKSFGNTGHSPVTLASIDSSAPSAAAVNVNVTKAAGSSSSATNPPTVTGTSQTFSYSVISESMSLVNHSGSLARRWPPVILLLPGLVLAAVASVLSM